MPRSPIKRFTALKRRRLSIFVFALAVALALWLLGGIASAIVNQLPRNLSPAQLIPASINRIFAHRTAPTLTTPVPVPNTTNNLTAASGTASLLLGTNWSLGHVPTVSEDATYTGTTTGIRALTAGVLTVGSFDITGSSGTFSIRNNTSGTIDSTLTLGGAGNLGNGVPGTAAGDLLYVATGSTFALRGDNGGGGTGVLKLVLGQSGNLNASGTGAMSSTAAISDGGGGFGITKTGAGSLTLSAVNTYTGNTTISAGTLALSGSGSIANSPTIELAGGSTFDVSGLTTALTLASGQALKGSGTTPTGTIATSATKGLTTASNSPLQFTAFNGATAPLTISGAGTVTLASGNQVTVNTTTPLGVGDYTLIAKGGGTVGGSAPLNLAPIGGSGLAGGTTASLIINANGMALHVATATTPKYRSRQSGNWSDFNTWQIDSGAGFINAVSGQTPTSTDDTIQIQSGHTVTVTASVSADQLTVDAGGTLTISGSVTLTIANGTGTDATVNGTLTNGGNLTLAASSLMNVGGTFTNSGIFNANTSTVDYDGSGAQTVAPVNYYNLNISGDRSGATVTMASGTVGIAHLFAPTATNVTYGVAGNTIEFNGSDLFRGPLPPAFNPYNNLTVNTGVGNTVAGFSGLKVDGTLEVKTGTFASASDYNNVLIDANGTLDLSGDITVSGNWTNNGTFNSNGNTVNFDGATVQAISGSTATAFAALAISNTGGAGNNNVSLAQNVSATQLNVSNGIFDQGTGSSITTGPVNITGGTWNNTGTGAVILSGNVVNTGTINFNSNGNSCEEVATNDISITSTGGQRSWSGGGTFTMTDVTVSNQGGTVPITVNSGTDGGGNFLNWIFINNCSAASGKIYTWVGPTGPDDSWQTATNWCLSGSSTCTGNPASYRNSQSSTDVLVFNGDSGDPIFGRPAPTVSNVSANDETITALRVINNAFPTFSTNAAHTLTINSPGSLGLNVTNLNINGGNPLTIKLSSGTLGSVTGTMTVSGAGHRLIGQAGGAITFGGSATFSTQTGFTGNAFGDGSNTANGAFESVVFSSGSVYQHSAGDSPFGLATSASVVKFNAGSEADWFSSAGFQASGRTYANLVIGDLSSSTQVSDSGAGDFTFDNLTINNGGSSYPKLTFTGSGSSIVNIKGNITSNGGAGSFQDQDVVLSGGASPGIVIDKQGGGTINFVDNSGNSRGIDFESDARVNSGTTLALARIVQMGQSNPETRTLTVVGPSGALTGSATGYVIGSLKKTFTGTGLKTFEVGTPNGYSPVDVNATAGTFDAAFTVSASQTKEPHIHGSGVNALKRYWNLTGTGITANLTFHYLDPTDIPTGFDDSTYIIFKYDGSFSTPGGTVNTGANTATINGVTSFSNWTLADPAAVTPGSLQFAAANFNDNETNADHNATITVTRTGGVDGAVSVHWATSAGTAAAGTDYTEASGDLNWADNDSADKTFTVTVKGDTAYEANETVNLTLSAPTGLASLGGQNTATLTITNDDAPPATLVVTKTADTNNTCLPGNCSLREAINAANFSIDASTINFNIPNTDLNFSGGVYTIQPISSLPAIANGRPVTIDGTSQTSFGSDTNVNGPEIVLNGSLTSGANGLTISASNSTVKSLVVNGFANGIAIGAAGTSNNQILDNYVGTNAAGTAAVPNVSIGVSMGTTTSSTVSGNLISGNGTNGIATCDVSSSTFSNNKVGTDRTGVNNVGNGSEGMHTFCTTFAGNTISGNTFAFNGSDGFRDQPDYGGGGSNNHPNNLITQNSFFSNTGLGINLLPPPNNTVDGVTPNDAGDGDIGGNNLQNFPLIRTALVGSPNTIRGTLNSTANQTFTIELFSNTACDGSGNGEGKTYLGSTPTTTGANGDGLWSFNPATLTDGDVITATATDANNNTSEFSACFTARAFTSGTVQFVGAPYTDSETNADHGKTITVSRTGGSDGALEVTYATSDGTAKTTDPDYVSASGTLHWNNGESGNKTFNITVKGDTTYEANETVNITLSNVTAGATIGAPNPTTLTITNDDAIPSSLVVTKTADTNDGFCTLTDCSLREAISNANANADASTISFNIPNTDPNRNVTTGVFAITPGSALPAITNPVTIDGYTQTPCSGNPAPCAQENTLAVGSDALLLIEIDGTNAGGYALIVDASDTVIKGLVINRSTQSEIWMNTGTNLSVRGNFLGTDAAGAADLGDTVRSGIEINATNGNTIGGPNPADRNVISGGNGAGIFIINSASNNTVQNNYIGTDKSGMLELGNGSRGVLIENRTNNIVKGNVISGNDADGVEIRGGGSTTPNQILGNIIGLKANGTEGMGNTGAGVILHSGATDQIIGGTLPGEGNTIAFNGGDGVNLTSGVNSSVRGNSIFSNGTLPNAALHLGIDLDPDGVTVNDAGDGDPGVNNLQNFPVIRTVQTGTPNVIRGTLNSTASQTFTIDLYATPASIGCDASGHGEGKTWLGSTTANTGANGDALWSFNPATMTPGDLITATATDTAGNTSEFSLCATAAAVAFGNIKFAQANTNDTETNSGTHVVNIVVQRVSGADRAVSVDYEITDGSATATDNDYSAVNGTLTWANGDATDRNIPITVKGDAKFEPDETVNIKLVNAMGGATIAGTNPVTLTITNDDSVPTISIDNVTHPEGNSSTTSYDFTVSLSHPSYLPITVDYATVNDSATAPSDFTSVTTTQLTFNPGETTKPVTVLVNGDLSVEPDEQFFVDLSSETNATIADNRGVGTIINDDTDVTVAVSTSSAAEDGATNLVYTFTRNPLTSGPITVNFSVGGTATLADNDYTQTGAATFGATSGTVVIPNSATTATVTINPVTDTTVEPDETVELAVTSGTGYNVGDPSSASAEITNDDTDVAVTVSPSSVDEDGAPNLLYTFTRTGVTSGAITANFSVGGAAAFPSDYAESGAASFSSSSGTVTFADGITTAIVTVDPTTDAVYELNETVILTVTSGTGYEPADSPNDSASGTINNDDDAPTLKINNVTLNEGTTPAGTTSFTFTVTKTGSTQVDATVNFDTADGTTNPATGGGSCGGGVDYQSQSGGMRTFLPSDTTKTITILVCRDSTAEANETFFVQLSGASNATIAEGEGRGTIQNDDQPPALSPVNTTNDIVDGSGCNAAHCSLREAINTANLSGTAVSITFAIPANDARHFYYKDDGVANQVTLASVTTTTTSDDSTLVGAAVDPIDPDWPHSWWSILTTSALPTISPVTLINIDGYTQTGASVNALTAADNAVLRIELTPDVIVPANTTGLSLSGGTSNVRGFAINRFSGNGFSIQGGSKSLTGDFIGTDVSGTLDLGNTGSGIISPSGFSSTIGGPTASDINLISGNNGDGLTFTNSNSNLILGNLIGTKANGVGALGNGGNGLTFTGPGSTFNTLGGIAAGEGNTVVSNGGDGVFLGRKNVGGSLFAPPGAGNSIRGNSIFSNGSAVNNLGIDLNVDGVTANDDKDPDTGPNSLQNFPIITSALVTGSTKTITGTLNSKVGETFTIDFYQSPSCDASGNGEGRTYLGSTSEATDGTTGDASFTFHPAGTLFVGQVVTATATSTGASFSTSEFSACFAVSDGSSGAGDIQFTSATYTVNENGGVAAISLTRVGGTNGQIQATFTTSDGTATAGSDYTDSTQTVTFNEGETSKTINIPIADDSTAEGNETVNLEVSHPPVILADRPDQPTVNPAIYDAVLTITNDDCPASFTVDSNLDTDDANIGDGVCATSGNVCTLRAAIQEANAALASCGAININFSGVTNPISLGSVLPDINHSVNINGPGADMLTVQRSSGSSFRIFTINPSMTVGISGLTISNGSAAQGGGIYNNHGTLTVASCAISGNSASVEGGGVYSGGVGAGNASLTISESTISGNNSANDGGGVYVNGGSGTASLTMINSTVSGNTASRHTGGVYVISATATLTNVTVTNNRADNNTDTVGAAGGLAEATGAVTLHNTLVAGNFRGGSPSTTRDDVNGILQGGSSFNLIGDGSGMSGVNDGQLGNHVGTSAIPIDPLLGALMNNGGPTSTHVLLYNSPALEQGDDAVTGLPLTLATDQRGLPRQADGDLVSGAVVDIGAYERQATESRDFPGGSNVNVDLGDVRVGFPSVGRVGGTLTVKVIDPNTQGAPPPNFSIGNDTIGPLPAFDVSTTASYTGPVSLCFYLPTVDNAYFAGLKLLHQEGGVLVDRTTAINFASKTVCGEVTSFSPFVLAHTATPTGGPGNVSGQILDQKGNPVEGAAVRMTGTQNRLTITDAAGNYRFDNVETNGFYTVTPARANFMFGPTERSFSQLGNHTDAVFTGSYNGGTVNPLDTTEYFVRQQYVDFLSREPDEAGFKFWVNNIEVCGAEQSCRANKRTETSAAFFLSVEFQQTGYLVYKIYQSAYGDIAGAPVPLTRSEFKPDTETIGQGVIVQQAGWETVLENNKRAFTAAFVSRPRFTTAFPTTLSPAAFVDKLFTNAGFVPSDSERSAAIGEFANAADTSNATARSKALRRVAESPTLNQQEFNQAFVLMQYFGYLRRSPNEAPEANLNYEGYTFWLTKLDHFNGNFQQAEMVKSFLVSGEYRQRFPK
jgi:CSLREA domain-containing protein